MRTLARAALPASLLLTACESMPQYSAISEPWESAGGRTIWIHKLVGRHGLVLEAIDWGATIRALYVPDRTGAVADVVLGFDTIAPYTAEHPYFGCIAGRCANRIARGEFEIDGKSYHVATNNGPNHLHGGVRGFGMHAWRGQTFLGPDGPAVKFERTSPDGEEGYPGALHATVTYTLTDDGALRTEMTATCAAPTLCNLAQHTYWNLAGHDAGSVAGHVVELRATHYLPVDETLIPTGQFAPVAGTPFDFTTPKPIGQDLARTGLTPPGFDHDFVTWTEKPGGDGMRLVCRVVEPRTGRVLELSSDQPGCQFYSGNFLDGSLRGKGGAVYAQHGGFCLETQRHPDSVHHPKWPTVVLRPGEKYRHVMVTRFSTEGAPSARPR